MRVLLVPPTYHYALDYPALLSASDFPSAYGYLTSALEQAGHQVIGFNPNNIIGYVNAETMLKDLLPKVIASSKPELIGFGGLATDYKFFKDAIAITRATAPKIPIVLGGQIMTNDAEDVMKLLRPDYGVVGEGEQVIVSLCDYITKGCTTPPPLNTYYWNNLELMNAVTDFNYRPVDDLPFPNYEPFGIKGMIDQFSMATRLLYRFSRTDPRPYNIVASRSCPFNCTFCVHGHRQIPYRARSIENIMEEIRVSYEKYHFNIVILLDELFAVSKDRMNDFSNAVLAGREKYGWDFDWMFQTHASAKLDLDSLKLAKKAGCFLFSYGLESASPTVLKSMNKKINPEQVVEAIHLAEEAKIGFSANLIFGDTAETIDTIAESLAFWLKNCKSSFVFLSHISAYPGSKLFNDARAKGLFSDKRAYYENIDKVPVNLTSLPEHTFQGLISSSTNSLVRFMETSWELVEKTKILKMEELNKNDAYSTIMGGYYYKFSAVCPYCKQEVEFVERMNDGFQPFWQGTGCPHCNRKIRVERIP